MKKFVCRIVILLLLSIPVLFAVDYVITKVVVYGGNGYYAEWCDIYQDNINEDLIILGSSRAKRHFNPLLIENCTNITAYNLGFTAASFDAMHTKFLEYYYHTSHKPQYVTLSLDCFSMSHSGELFDHWRVLPFLLYSQNLRQRFADYDCFPTYYYYLPLVRYSGYFYKILRSFVLTHSILYHGYYLEDPHHQQWNQDDFLFNKRNNTGIVAQIDSCEVADFKQFIVFCKTNSIKLNIVYTPEYYGGQCFTANRDSVLSFYQSVAQEYQTPFRDFSVDSINYDTAFFSNVMHLNSKGADEFTQKYYVPYLMELYGNRN